MRGEVMGGNWTVKDIRTTALPVDHRAAGR